MGDRPHNVLLVVNLRDHGLKILGEAAGPRQSLRDLRRCLEEGLFSGTAPVNSCAIGSLTGLLSLHSIRWLRGVLQKVKGID